MMRALIIALVLLALGAGGYYFYQQSQDAVEAEAAAAEAAVVAAQTDGVAALALFNEICIAGRENFAATEALATGAGWAIAADDVHPSTARITGIARGADVGATGTVLHVYAHPQRSEFIMLSDLTIQGDRLNGCYVYDFNAGGIPDLSVQETALGAPFQRESHPGVIEARSLVGPPSFPSVASVRIGYIPRGSAAEAQAGFTGLALSMTSMSR